MNNEKLDKLIRDLQDTKYNACQSESKLQAELSGLFGLYDLKNICKDNPEVLMDQIGKVKKAYDDVSKYHALKSNLNFIY